MMREPAPDRTLGDRGAKPPGLEVDRSGDAAGLEVVDMHRPGRHAKACEQNPTFPGGPPDVSPTFLVGYEAESTLWGIDLDITREVVCSGCLRAGWGFGVRYIGFDDREDPLTVVFPDASSRPLADVSFLLGRLREEKLERVRLIFPAELRDAVRSAVASHAAQ